jgi:hypothetical protein
VRTDSVATATGEVGAGFSAKWLETSMLELTVNQGFSYVDACIAILTLRDYNLPVSMEQLRSFKEALCYVGR